ncbi:MAG: hypothetical protein ACOCYB_10015 [Alkalispirochaeta sp.]
MAKKTLLFTVIGVYQVVRFVVLTAILVFMIQMSSPPGFSGVALSVGGAAVLPAVLMLQWILTRSPVLIPPLRVALTLQALGSAVTMMQVIAARTAPPAISPAAVILTGILVLLDAVAALFLLLYTPQTREQRSPRESHESPAAPPISVEEVEDE